VRAVWQRVSRAVVRVEGQVVGEIGPGALVLVAAQRDDTEAQAAKLADRVVGLRAFNDGEGKMNLALADVPGGAILAVSNFTVCGDAAKSRRPSFTGAASYEAGRELFDRFVAELRGRGVRVETGVFGADMQVELVNDGPVTLILEV